MSVDGGRGESPGGSRGESLASRSAKLTQLVLEKGNQDLAYRHLVSRDALLDALFLLYDECCGDQLRRNKNVAQFLDKYHPAVTELRQLQVNINDFEVRRVIGKGHFGEVHLVQENLSSNIYAMKILRKSLTLEQQSVAFYEEERDIMMKGCSNPWLTSLQYSFQDSRNLYLVMEFLPGGDMLSLLERNDNLLPEDVAQFYLAEIVLAIHSLHSMGYVHRDIKPDNILIERTGHIKLADFGSAAKLNENKQVTSKMPVGTPDYIAPEVLTTMNKGAGPHYGVGCDWWSLGIVAYEMLFGVTPFGNDKVLVTYANIMNFKEKLTFPDDIQVSDSAISLVRGLLQDAKTRLSYKELYDHDFFKDIDWMNIQKAAPPYVPTVSSQDDTSHFDEFDSDIAQHKNFEPFNPKKEFSGKNLPFVGFTYNSCLSYVSDKYGSMNDTLNSMASSGTFMRSSLTLPRNHGRNGGSKETQLKKQVVALEAMESTLRSEVALLRSRAKRSQEQVELQQEEREKTATQVNELEAEVKSLRLLLDLERKNSMNTEKRAVELLKGIESKYKKREALLKEAALHLCPNLFQQTGQSLLALGSAGDSDLNEQQLKATQYELTLCKQELAALRGHQDTKVDLNEQMNSSTFCQLLNSHSSSDSSTLTNGTIAEITVIPREPVTSEDEWANKLKKSEELRMQSDRRIEQLTGQLKSLSEEHEDALKEMHDEYTQHLAALKKVISRLEEHSLQSEDSRPTRDDSDLGTHSRCRQEAENLQDKVNVLEADLLLNRQFLDSLQKKYDSLKDKSKSKIQALEAEVADMKGAKTELDRRLTEQEVEFKNQLKNQEAAVVEQLSFANEVFKEQLSQLQLRTKEVDVALTQLELDGVATDEKDKGVTLSVRDNPAVPPSQLSFRESTGGSTILSPEILHKMLSMEAVLHKIHETQISETNQLWELKGKLWKCEKEISDKQLDVRIAEREKREALESVSQSREVQRSLRERLSTAEKEHGQCAQRESTLKDQLASALRDSSAKEEAWQGRLNRWNSEKQVLEDRLSALKEERKNAKDLEEQCARSEGQYIELDRQNENLKDRTEKLEDEKQYLLGELESLRLDLRNKTKNCQQLEKSVQALKHASTTLEGMTKDLENALESQEKDLLHSRQAEANLQRELDKLRRELKGAEENILTERKYREERELYFTDVRREHTLEVEELENRISSLEEELTLQTEAVRQLSSQSFQLEKDLQAQVTQKRALETKNASLEDETLRIKEEASTHITTIAQLKRNGIDLQESLEASENKVQETLWTIEQMNNENEREKASFHQELVKQDAQLQQHAKLIDLLQLRLREQSEKKKKWLFGLRGNAGKENKGPTPTRPPVEKKRDRGFRHYVELREAMPKLSTATTESSGYVPSGSPGRTSSLGSVDGVSLAGSNSSNEDSLRSTAMHIYYESSVRQPGTCVGCSLHIPTGRASVRCRGCDVICHRSCKELVPRECPFLSQVSAPSVHRKPLSSVDFGHLGGWIKVPRSRNAGWESRFVRIVRGKQLWISDREIPVDPSSTASPGTLIWDLCPADGVVTLKKFLSPGDLQCTTTDIQNMVKLTVWPDKPEQGGCRDQVLLFGEYEEKWRWCQAMERPLTQHLRHRGKIIGYSELKSCVVLNLEKCPLQVTCCCHLTKQLLLLGSAEGLYLVNLSLPPQLALRGRLLPSSSSSPSRTQTQESFVVHKLVLAKRLGIVLVVTGGDQQLVTLQAASILEWEELSSQGVAVSPLRPSPVGLLKGIQHMDVSQSLDVNPVVLGACSLDMFYLLKWNAASRQFITKQEVRLCQPCVALHISKEVILFAADKVFVVDLKEPGTCVEEFLDSANANALTLVVNDILKRRNSPVGLFTCHQNAGDRPLPKPAQEEYLLVTRDLGVVVNYLGQQDQQNQLGWAIQPNAFAHCSGFLFALDTHSIEMVMVDPNQPNLRGNWSFLELSQALFLGSSAEDESLAEEHAIYVAANSAAGNALEVFRICGNSLLAHRTSSNNNIELERNTSIISTVSDAFSFTSSVEDALDTADSSTC